MKTSVILRSATAFAIKETHSHLRRPTHLIAANGIASETTKERIQKKKHPIGRFYCQVQFNQTECWHCKSKTKKVNFFICTECGKLQDITNEHDYFELLSLPRDFDIPASKLAQVFRQLQTLVHPDKFSNKSEREKENSAEWSAFINRAYKTLSQPIARGKYLLKLQGEEMPTDNSALDKGFLMNMMERNEEVADADTLDDLRKMDEKVQEEITEETDKLKILFRENNLQSAKAKLVKMKYLVSIQSSIRTKIEKCL